MPELLRVDHLSTTRAEVNLDCLRHNTRRLSARSGDARIMAIVKANAYGHGAVPVAHALTNEGVEHLAVATLPEAVELREAGITGRVLVLGAPLEEMVPYYDRYNVEITVSSQATAKALLRLAREGYRFAVHVKVDTGMSRLGLSPAEAPPVIRKLASASNIRVAAVWSHLATGTREADPMARAQLDRLTSVWQAVADLDIDLHLEHTGALLSALPRIAPPERMLVRPGLGLYGYDPENRERIALKPVMRLVSQVTHVKTIEPGTSVSYRGTWTAERPARIATVGAGYADGVPYTLSNRGQVRIGSACYPIVGEVCMDMFMVHLGAPGEAPEVAPGTEAVLYGGEGPTAAEVAAAGNTTIYELLCRVASRVPRVYLNR